MATLKRVTIYTDGACLGNPGPGGYGVILQYGDHRKELSGGYRLTTNNRMELTAAIRGLAALKEPCRVQFFSDSEYFAGKQTAGIVRTRKWLKIEISGKNSSDSVKDIRFVLSGSKGTQVMQRTSDAISLPYMLPSYRTCLKTKDMSIPPFCYSKLL